MRVNRSATENCFKPRSSSLEKKMYSTKASFHTKYSFHETLLRIICNKKYGDGTCYMVLVSKILLNQQVLQCKYLVFGLSNVNGTVNVQSNEQTLPQIS